jgi:hypothetical protein
MNVNIDKNINPSIQLLEQKEDEFIKTLASFKAIEQKLFQDAQQGNFNNKQQLLSSLQSLLNTLESILNDMKNSIQIPFDKGLANVNVSELTSTQLLHQSFNLDKASEIYHQAKVQFETLIGERDNTKINYNRNKSLFNFWFILSIILISILILYLKGYNVFKNGYIYGIFILIIYLYFDIIKSIYNNILNIFISTYESIINIIRLFT